MCVAYGLESVAYTKLVTFCSVITSPRSPPLSSGLTYQCHKKRNRRLKDHKELQEIAKRDPDTEDIFEDSLLDTHYPQRPNDLEDICLYDFVPNYDWQTKGDNVKYAGLKKPHLPNHKLFDPQKETQREDYFYSLLLLFVPFRYESSLLLDNETAEVAFHSLMNVDSSAYHDKFQKILEAQSTIKDINEARQADGAVWIVTLLTNQV